MPSINRLSLSDDIKIAEHADRSSLILPWEIDSVVTLKGSFRTQPDFAEGEELVQDLLVGMLDKGTATRGKLEIARELEDRGASIAFSSSSIRVRFELRCLRPDLDRVLGILHEQLTNPGLDESEYSLLQGRLLGNVQRMCSDTDTRASNALSRLIYSENHPAYRMRLSEMEDRIRSVSIDRLRAYFDQQFGARSLTLSTVGDLVDRDPSDLLHRMSENWKSSRLVPTDHDLRTNALAVQSEHIEIEDRLNLDVKMGHGVDIRRNDPQFIPLFLGVFVLGGNFSSRLMSTIRDRDGLTYGIRSALSSVTEEFPGSWITSVALSQDKLEKGMLAVRSEISRFLKEGILLEELEERKKTVTGSYQVQLSSTGGVASTLLSNRERGYALDRIDSYPEEINSAELEAVNSALSEHLSESALHAVSAGTRG